ncbi:MAG: CoA pyrophosphatase [Alphaproteobacteria bacterium]|nr:MAG: CoA pyrophosphatase [Alphaproteobacteria bacterium]
MLALPPARALRSDFDLLADSGKALPTSAPRRAAVLVPVHWPEAGRDDDARLILTRRASDLSAHAGQVAFPGGRVEKGERDEEAALREAREEIALAPSRVEIAGRLEPYRTVTDYLVTPIIGFIEGPLELVADPREVAEIFTVPMRHVLDMSRYEHHVRNTARGRRAYYVLPHETHFIWGATAHMLYGLAERFARLMETYSDCASKSGEPTISHGEEQ